MDLLFQYLLFSDIFDDCFVTYNDQYNNLLEQNIWVEQTNPLTDLSRYISNVVKFEMETPYARQPVMATYSSILENIFHPYYHFLLDWH